MSLQIDYENIMNQKRKRKSSGKVHVYCITTSHGFKQLCRVGLISEGAVFFESKSILGTEREEETLKKLLF